MKEGEMFWLCSSVPKDPQTNCHQSVAVFVSMVMSSRACGSSAAVSRPVGGAYIRNKSPPPRSSSWLDAVKRSAFSDVARLLTSVTDGVLAKRLAISSRKFN